MPPAIITPNLSSLKLTIQLQLLLVRNLSIATCQKPIDYCLLEAHQLLLIKSSQMLLVKSKAIDYIQIIWSDGNDKTTTIFTFTQPLL